MREAGYNGFGNYSDVDVLIDIRRSDLRLGEVMTVIKDFVTENPDREVWMDGDMYAIVSAPRRHMA